MSKERTTQKQKITSTAAFTAFEVSGEMDVHIQKASPKRTWMDQTRDRFAYRCLPMVIANQMGWWIPNQVDFNAKWNGGPNPDDVTITMPKGKTAFGKLLAEDVVVSNFGEGVITFSIPYLFRTPEGTNLWVRGPANFPRDGIQALEGIVETDWSHSTFTMNWKFTRPNHLVRFRPGEPICQIVPIQRHFAEQMEPIPFGKANIVRPGKEVTIISYSRTVLHCLEAAATLAAQGVDAEVIDLRTIRPLDMETIFKSIRKTNRIVTVEEAWPVCSIGSEICAQAAIQAFDYLDAPPAKVSGADVPMPYAANLEKLALPTAAQVVAAAKGVLYA